MKKNNKGKEILKLLQENYEIETGQDLSAALIDMFKGTLQETMNAEFDSSMGILIMIKQVKKLIIEMALLKRIWKVSLVLLNLKHLEIEMVNFNLK